MHGYPLFYCIFGIAEVRLHLRKELRTHCCSESEALRCWPAGLQACQYPSPTSIPDASRQCKSRSETDHSVSVLCKSTICAQYHDQCKLQETVPVLVASANPPCKSPLKILNANPHQLPTWIFYGWEPTERSKCWVLCFSIPSLECWI